MSSEFLFKKKTFWEKKPKRLYVYMTHLFRIYNMFLGNTKHNNEFSKIDYCTEVI
jgi:hypothetical protein